MLSVYTKNQQPSEIGSFIFRKGIVTEALSGNNKAYKTSEVGDWLAANI